MGNVSMINGHIDRHDSDRDKLIELLNKHQDYSTKHFYSECGQEIFAISNDVIADYLIANGFGFREKEGT